MKDIRDNIWLDCIKSRLRFPSHKGDLNVEDLFQLGLDDLNTIYMDLDASIQSKGRSLKKKVADMDLIVQKKLDIVESVYALKKLELADKEEAIRKNEKKHRIMELIHKKEDEELSDLSVDELKDLLGDLE